MRQKMVDWLVYELIFLISKKEGSTWVNVNNFTEFVFFYTDHHNSMAWTGPILKQNFIVKLVLLFQIIKNILIKFFIILYCFQVVDVQTGYFLVVGYVAYVLIIFVDFMSKLDPLSGYFS